jgi:hypothetical protein
MLTVVLAVAEWATAERSYYYRHQYMKKEQHQLQRRCLLSLLQNNYNLTGYSALQLVLIPYSSAIK